MRDENFLNAYNLINESLINLKMDRTFNSIGSNVFFEFGKEKEVVYKNGKKQLKKDWSIWISNASWRITKSNQYIVGSGDSPKVIQSSIQKLLDKRFQTILFLSQFLDVEFNFEDGYQIQTFFNAIEEDQWVMFFPDESNIEVDCSSEIALKNVQDTASYFKIIESYKKLNTTIEEKVVSKIYCNEDKLPVFYFEGDFSLILESCTWRLEKNSNYVIGCLDDDLKKIKNELLQLVGKKIKQVDIANPMMDARFQFEDGFILKTFSCCHTAEQWKIFSENKPIFSAQLPLLEN